MLWQSHLLLTRCCTRSLARFLRLLTVDAPHAACATIGWDDHNAVFAGAVIVPLIRVVIATVADQRGTAVHGTAY